jgi:hypothetical protein
MGIIFKRIAIISLSIAVLAGCTGAPMRTENLNEDQYTVIGHGEANATGIMLLGFIPIGQNSRFVRAQNAAIQRNGGDAMINTQVQERWFYAYILSGYTTTVSGDIVKLKAEYTNDDLDKLKRLKKMYDDGLINEAEYAAEKKEILDD